MQVISNFFGSVMRFIYQTVSQMFPEPEFISYFAISIMVMTVLYKLITLPITISTIKTQEINAKIQPEMQKIQKKYKNNPEIQQQKIMELQKEHGYNPLMGCLPMILQLVLVYALFRVMRTPEAYMFGSGVDMDTIARNFFWIPNLSNPDPIIFGLPLINGLTQYLMFTIMQPKSSGEGNEMMQSMNTSMKYVMPVMIFIMTRTFAAGLALYWAFGNVIEIIFRLIIKRRDRGKSVKELEKDVSEKGKDK